MRIEILEAVKDDFSIGYEFYERQSSGLGSYFLDSVISDIDSLLLYAEIHPVVFGSHRCLASRFPFAIYYEVEGDVIRISGASPIGRCSRQRPSS
jgi:hypothetical protein